jgi:hypothetical protein
MSEDIKLGETRTFFPPEGVPSIRAQGQSIQSEGTPLQVTQELLTLHENGMVRIGEVSTAVEQPTQPQPPVQDQSAQQQPSVEPGQPYLPPAVPQETRTGEPNTLPGTPGGPPEQVQTPLQSQQAPQPQQQPPEVGTTQASSLPTSEEIDNMDENTLREFVTSIGHDPTNRRRAFLVRTAKAYIEAVQPPQ